MSSRHGDHNYDKLKLSHFALKVRINNLINEALWVLSHLMWCREEINWIPFNYALIICTLTGNFVPAFHCKTFLRRVFNPLFCFYFYFIFSSSVPDPSPFTSLLFLYTSVELFVLFFVNKNREIFSVRVLYTILAGFSP